MTASRRGVLLGLGAALWSSGAALGHTPYRQWVIYRQKHLLIGAHRGDEGTYAHAKIIVAALEKELPDARARIARGPRPQRIASLMATGQLLISVLAEEDADLMSMARPPFEGYRPTPLRQLATLDGTYHLFASPDLPPDHAYLVVGALHRASIAKPPAASTLPVHPGAASFWEDPDAAH